MGRFKDVINFAKLKTSYGTLGNQGNSAGYLHIPTMAVAPESGWIFNGSRLPYVKTPGILNMSRTWEKITTLDVGLEMRALDSRLSAELGYFNRRSWDIIGPPTPKAAVLGTSAPSINNAEFVTNGFEMQLSWRDQINEQWDYGVSLNLADGRSKVTKYNSASNSFGQNADGSEKWYEGKVFGEIWGYKVDRFLTKDDFDENGKLLVDQSKIHANWYPGDVKYEDLDGDGEITPGNSTVEEPGDLRIIGNTTPRFRYGINLSTGYEFEKAGRLDLSLFFEGVAKRDLFMMVLSFSGEQVLVIHLLVLYMIINGIWIFIGMEQRMHVCWNIWVKISIHISHVLMIMRKGIRIFKQIQNIC